MTGSPQGSDFEVALNAFHQGRPSIAGAIAALRSTADEETDEFGDQIRRLVFFPVSDSSKAANAYNILRRVLDDDSLDVVTRYKAFKAIIHFDRRNRNFTRLRASIYQYQELFGSFETFNLILFTNSPPASTHEYVNAVALAEAAALKHPASAGIQNAYAEFVSNALSEGVVFPNPGEVLQRAQAANARSIILRPRYAKYHATKARLLMLEQQFDAAKQAVRDATDLEDSSASDYAVRIQDYSSLLFSIEQRKSELHLASALSLAQSVLTDEIEKTRREFEKDRRSNIEILGFFTAIISVIVTAIQIPASDSVTAGRLFMTYISMLMFAFAGFTFILHGPSQWLRSLPLIAIAILVLFLSNSEMPRFPGGGISTPSKVTATKSTNLPAAKKN